MEAKGIIIGYPKFISPSHFEKIVDIKMLVIHTGDWKAIKLSQQEWDKCVAAKILVL